MFSDKKYLNDQLKHLKSQAEKLSLREKLAMYSGALLKWTADYLSDGNIKWQKRKIKINDLTLAGTNPEGNKIIIDKCQRSPEKFRILLKKNPKIKKIFKDAKLNSIPILVRYEEKEYKVLDGMHRVIGAILANKSEITAFVGKVSNPRSWIEPHVVYDLLKANQRKLNTNREDLICALRFLCKAYINVEDLLKNRFNDSYVYDKNIQEIIKKVLAK